MNNMNIKIPIVLASVFTTTLFSATSTAEKSLIDTVRNHIQTEQSLRVTPKKENSKSNAHTRIMVRLKAGVNPNDAYQSFLKTNKLSALDATLIKSFPLVDQTVSISGKKAPKKHLLIIQSEKISENELLRMANAIQGVDLVEKSLPIRLNSVNNPSPVIPSDERVSELWGMNNYEQTGGTEDADIDAVEAWEKHQGSSNVVVGVIDTGLDYRHLDLVNNVWVNYAELNGVAGVDDDNNGYIDDFHGIDTYNFDTDPMDDNGHGTHCAGTIAAEGNNTIGVVGVNWRTKVAACKFLSEDGYGYTDGAVECVNYFNTLKENGVNIVATNNSWGGGGASQVLEDAIATGAELGINFVAAAGNSNQDNDSNPHYPSNYDVDGLIAVAATDHDDNLASFSSYGATTVDLAAPGVDILSTLPSDTMCVPDGGTTYFSEDFEAGISNWSMLSINLNSPFYDIPEEHFKLDTTDGATGSNSLSDSLNSNYSNNILQSAITTMDLSDIPANQTVCASLKIKGKIEPYYDFLQIYVSNDNGSSWQSIGTQIDGEFNDWTEVGVVLGEEYHVENLKVALVRYSDCCVVYEGYNIDDIKISTGTVTSVPNYGVYSGTSMATPHVTGAIAYFASINDQENVSQRKARILNSVDVLGDLNGVVATSGRLNINNYLSTLNYEPIVGEWTLNYNWTAGTSSLVFNDDFTFTTNEGNNGTWTYNGSAIEFIFSNGTTYSTTALDLIAGTMSGTMFNGGHGDTIPDGNWTATRDSGGFIVDNDFNGDGVSDVLIRNISTGTMYSMLLASDGSYQGYTHMVNLSNAYSILETARLNSDNVSDILLRHTSSGRLYSMIINSDGTKKYYRSLGIYPVSEWTIKGVKDLTGDGIDDILISNNNSGNLYTLILKTDGGLLRAENHGNLSSWSVAGIADLNGDGINDVLIRRTSDGKMYSMLIDSNGERIGYRIIGTFDPSIWSVEAVAKFNNDNTADVMIKNTSSGQRMNLLLNNNGNLDSMVDLGTLSTSWITSNIGDYNGDGIMDVQIQNTIGKTYSLLMNPDGTRHSYKYVAKFTPSSWTQYISSNHNDDTTSDLLLRRNTGRVYTWLMDNNANSTLKPLGSPSFNWAVKNK